MKIKAISLIIITCFVIASCETIGINNLGINNIGDVFSSLQSGFSNSGSQSNSTQSSNSQSGSTQSSGTQNNSSQNRTTTTAAPVQVTRDDPNRRADPDAANWDIAALDTAANVDYLTGIEKDVILEMNKVRTNPQKYVELYIQPLLRYFNGNNYSVPGQITIITQEGVAAVNSCITVLNMANSVDILTPERGLSLAAKDHVTDQSRTGQTGHNGSDNSTPETRMRRYGVFGRTWTYGENIDYGDTNGREIVCSLVIDDGVPNRGHRTSIMNSAFTQTGVGYGTHTQYRTICTITYAAGYSSN